jgi:hypothetical protein
MHDKFNIIVCGSCGCEKSFYFSLEWIAALACRGYSSNHSTFIRLKYFSSRPYQTIYIIWIFKLNIFFLPISFVEYKLHTLSLKPNIALIPHNARATHTNFCHTDTSAVNKKSFINIMVIYSSIVLVFSVYTIYDTFHRFINSLHKNSMEVTRLPEISYYFILYSYYTMRIDTFVLLYQSDLDSDLF